jgi:hypothetical protein
MTGPALVAWTFMYGTIALILYTLVGAAADRRRSARELARREAEGADEDARTALLALYQEWDQAWGSPHARPESVQLALEEALLAGDGTRARAALARLPGAPTPGEQLAGRYAEERARVAGREGRGRARRRIGKIVLGGVGGLIAILTTYALWPDPRAAGIPVEDITVHEAAARVAQHRGRVTLVVIYQARCGCAEMVAQLAAYARRHRSELDIVPFAYSTDADDLRDFLVQYNHPFEGARLIPWQKGELIAAMKPVDVYVPEYYKSALVTLLDADGRRIATWNGQHEAAPVVAVLQQAIAQHMLARSVSADTAQ